VVIYEYQVGTASSMARGRSLAISSVDRKPTLTTVVTRYPVGQAVTIFYKSVRSTVVPSLNFWIVLATHGILGTGGVSMLLGWTGGDDVPQEPDDPAGHQNAGRVVCLSNGWPPGTVCLTYVGVRLLR